MTEQNETSWEDPYYREEHMQPPSGLPPGSGFSQYHVSPRLEGIPHIFIRASRSQTNIRPLTSKTVEQLWSDIRPYVKTPRPIKADRSALYVCCENDEELRELVKTPPLCLGWRDLPLGQFGIF